MHFQTSRHVEEALARLTETYLALGIILEAQTAAAVLGRKFPNSHWTTTAHDALRSKGLEPAEKSNPGSAGPSNRGGSCRGVTASGNDDTGMARTHWIYIADPGGADDGTSRGTTDDASRAQRAGRERGTYPLEPMRSSAGALCPSLHCGNRSRGAADRNTACCLQRAQDCNDQGVRHPALNL